MKILGLGLVAAFVVVAVWACYPKRVGPAGADGERLTWTEMNKDQRKAHMRDVVLPLAADVFQAWRPERYAKVDCTLCHGDSAHWEDFQMPTSPDSAGPCSWAPSSRSTRTPPG